MSNNTIYTGIGMNVSTMGYGANTSSRILSLNVDSEFVFYVDAKGLYRSKTMTVSSLPTASANLTGTRSFVTDANNYSFANVAYSGGTNAVPVYCDGTYWRIG
jgi:hypothetical protein